MIDVYVIEIMWMHHCVSSKLVMTNVKLLFLCIVMMVVTNVYKLEIH